LEKGAAMTGSKTQNKRETASKKTTRVAEQLSPQKDLMEYLKDYAREKPDVAALWCFGIGFVLGWKIKPW
jgi:hypothetical protein